MPFRRTRRRTRRRRTRRPTALRAVRRLARFVDTELNQSLLIAEDQSAFFGTPIFLPLMGVSQGNDDNQRHGLQVTMRSLNVKFIVGRANSDELLRVIVFVDKQTNGLTPLLGDVLQVVATSDQAMTSPKSNDNKRRFTFFHDRTYKIINDNSNFISFNVNRSLSGKKVRYDGTTTAVADVVSGMPWILLQSTSPNGGAAPIVAFVSRIMFAP